MQQTIKKKDDPAELLEKPSYKTVVMKAKAPYLNTLFAACCYSSESVFKVYKWNPIDSTYDLANGESGKRIMKLKEQSPLTTRCFCPASCRGYINNIQAEYNRKVVIRLTRETKPTFGPWARPVGYL